MERNYLDVKFGLPTGYRFCPPDDLLIMDYLMNKIMGYKLPADMINEIDLYAFDPPLLPMSEFNHGRKANEAYFFTLIPQTYGTTQQMERAINGGSWRATGETRQIYHKNEIVGFKRIFVFYEGQAPTAKKSSFVMHEFSVNPSLVSDDEPDLRAKTERYVLCRIIDKERAQNMIDD
ncbi:hypothetical protein CRYUN_Cryun08bG0061800 [Craigia yunnanensis]